jgi:hypothetical protein
MPCRNSKESSILAVLLLVIRSSSSLPLLDNDHVGGGTTNRTWEVPGSDHCRPLGRSCLGFSKRRMYEWKQQVALHYCAARKIVRSISWHRIGCVVLLWIHTLVEAPELSMMINVLLKGCSRDHIKIAHHQRK